MPEEKDKPTKENGELSLEEQLQALLRGLPAKPGEEEQPQQKQAPPENLGAEQTIPPSPILETPRLPDEPLPLPQPPEMKIEPPIQFIPGSAVTGRETDAKPVADSSKSPLTDELAALFGTTPPATGTPRLTSLPPTQNKPVGGPVGPVISTSPVSEPVTKLPSSDRLQKERGPIPAPQPEVPVSAPAQEVAFKDEVIKGPKPAKPLFGMSFLQTRTISISIEGTSLRILTLTGNSIETWASIPIEPKFLREGYIANVSGMGEVISKALESLNIGAGKLVCGFTSLGSTSRILALPQSAKKDLTNIIPRELRRASINTDNLILNWRMLPVKEGPLQVFILGIPKEPMLSMIEALKISKLKPSAAELKPLALARAVNKKDAIIAHGERDSLELALVVEGIPGLLRSIYLGVETTPDQVASRLVEELERTIYFYNSTHRERPLDPQIPVYITGEIANFSNLIGNGQVPGLDRVIAPLEPPLKLPKDFPAALFMVNIGLLLKKA